MYYTITIDKLIDAENESMAWAEIAKLVKIKIAMPSEPVSGFDLYQGDKFSKAAEQFFDGQHQKTLADVEDKPKSDWTKTRAVTEPGVPVAPPVPQTLAIAPPPPPPPPPAVKPPVLPPVAPPVATQVLPELPPVTQTNFVKEEKPTSNLRCFGRYDSTDSICLNCQSRNDCTKESQNGKA